MSCRIDLSGVWNISYLPETDFQIPENLPKEIHLPSTTAQAKIGFLNEKNEVGFLTEAYPYKGSILLEKRLFVEKELSDSFCILNLERSRKTLVTINGVSFGEQDSFAVPHRYEISKALKFGAENLIQILVSNTGYTTGGGHMTSPDTQTNWIGILGDLSLSFRKTPTLCLKAYPDIDCKKVQIRGFSKEYPIEISSVSALEKQYGKEISQIEHLTYQWMQQGEILEIQFPSSAKLWSEEHPCFYELKIFHGTDMESVSFGFRSFSPKGRFLYLNNKKTFLRGKHDGMLFPLSGAAPMNVDEWISVFQKAMEYGINHYRFHTCCPPDAAFTAADYMGILMEPELPFWGTISAPDEEGYREEEQQFLYQEGLRILDAFGNHPSFVMFSMGNELWGNSQHIGSIMAKLQAHDHRPLYTQGSNNFQFFPCVLSEDDFFCGVRMGRERLIRGSYAMCDAPLGHVQTDIPSTLKNYESALFPHTASSENCFDGVEIEIQFGTGVKKVKKTDENNGEFICHKPVISHEVGQYYTYPSYKQLSKYTGVLKPGNLEIFRDHLRKSGMEHQAEEFFYCSGKLAVSCYKEEIESAMRTPSLSGFQLLDIQDFTGQNTALVGILDAFMDSKGLIRPEEWQGFCSDFVLLAMFDRYVLESGADFSAQIQLRHTREMLQSGIVECGLETEDFCEKQDFSFESVGNDLYAVGMFHYPLPMVDKVTKAKLTLRCNHRTNEYHLVIMPQAAALPQFENGICWLREDVLLTDDFSAAESALENGKRVLYIAKNLKHSVDGFYAADFWNYTMFRQISESMNKPLPVGTLGLTIHESKALEQFPSEAWTTPQWYDIIMNGKLAILDTLSLTPIVQMIDNVERNHKLGLLFSCKVGKGALLVCTSDLWKKSDSSVVKQFYHSLESHIMSDDFAPEDICNIETLKTILEPMDLGGKDKC